MQLNKPVFIVIMVLSIVIAGFAAGSFAGAYILGEPGSEMDPLVAESYLKEAVEQTTGELKEQIVALQEQIEELREKLAGLESRGVGVSTASRSKEEKPKAVEQPKTQKPVTKPDTEESKPSNSSVTVSSLASEPGKTGVVFPDKGANLRTGPSTEFERVTTVAQGTRVEIIAEKQGWYEVKLNEGAKGWIFGELIERD